MPLSASMIQQELVEEFVEELGVQGGLFRHTGLLRMLRGLRRSAGLGCLFRAVNVRSDLSGLLAAFFEKEFGHVACGGCQTQFAEGIEIDSGLVVREGEGQGASALAAA